MNEVVTDAGTYQIDHLTFANADYGFDNGLGDVEDLTPLQRLEKYLDSDNIFNSQMLARGLLDTLRAVFESDDNCMSVLDAMSRLSEDPKPSVRCELMEQVPHIAFFCQEKRLTFDSTVPRYILPMVVRYLNDASSQVRKTSQAALLALLEQGLVEKNDIEKQVVHVILVLAAPESPDDYRSDAAALMSKMAPLLGKDITERHFLPSFSEMCTDPLFHVRKWMEATVIKGGDTLRTYSSCYVKTSNVDNWLRLPFIERGEANALHISLTFTTRKCSKIIDSSNLQQCKANFNLYYLEADSNFANALRPSWDGLTYTLVDKIAADKLFVDSTDIKYNEESREITK